MDISVRRRMMMGGKKKFTVTYEGLHNIYQNYYAYIELPESGEEITGSGTLLLTEGDYVVCRIKESDYSSYIKKDGETVASAASGKSATYRFYPTSNAIITVTKSTELFKKYYVLNIVTK